MPLSLYDHQSFMNFIISLKPEGKKRRNKCFFNFLLYWQFNSRRKENKTNRYYNLSIKRLIYTKNASEMFKNLSDDGLCG